LFSGGFAGGASPGSGKTDLGCAAASGELRQWRQPCIDHSGQAQCQRGGSSAQPLNVSCVCSSANKGAAGGAYFNLSVRSPALLRGCIFISWKAMPSSLSSSLPCHSRGDAGWGTMNVMVLAPV